MLKKRIQKDLNFALKEKRELELSVLRLLLTSILNREKEKRYKLSKEDGEPFVDELNKRSQLLDEEILDVIFAEIKKRREAQLLYEKGGRQELAEKEKEEMGILQKYLPEQVSEKEIIDLTKKTIEETGATSLKDMGKVMAQIMPKLKGRADGSLVSKIVKESLTELSPSESEGQQ